MKDYMLAIAFKKLLSIYLKSRTPTSREGLQYYYTDKIIYTNLTNDIVDKNRYKVMRLRGYE